MKLTVIWHQGQNNSVAHAYRQQAGKRGRALCAVSRVKWPPDAAAGDAPHCKACTGAIRNLEAKWAAEAADSLRLSED